MKPTRRAERVVAVLAVIAACAGCMGVVKNRDPRIPRRHRNVQVEVTPAIDLVFKCRSRARDGAWEGRESMCSKQRKAFSRVVGEFDFLTDATEGREDPDYRLEVRADWTRGYTIAPANSEGCYYLMMMWIPCVTKDRLETSAVLSRPDGEVVGEAKSSADRRFIMHTTGIWLFPAGLPSLPAYLRFSANTYRNLLPQTAEQLVRDQARRGAMRRDENVRQGRMHRRSCERGLAGFPD